MGALAVSDINPAPFASKLQRYEQLVESSPDSIVVLSLDGRVLDLNDATVNLLGYSRDEAIGRHPKTLWLPPADTPLYDTVLDKLAKNERVQPYEAVRIHKNGSQIDVLLSAFTIYDQGKPIAYAAICRDIRAEKMAQKRLRDMQNDLAHVARLSTLGQMVSVLTHEVTQPLSAIGLMTDNIRRLSKDNPELIEAVNRLDAQVERANSIVANFRQFAKKGNLSRKPEKIKPLIQTAIDLVMVAYKTSRVKLIVDCSDDITANVNTVQFEQVIVNLVRNALDATQHIAAPKLVFEVWEDEIYVNIRLSDNGPGIPADLCSKIFQPYFTSKPKGLGIGLMVCREIINNHGGKITLEHSDYGACFLIRFPK